VSARADNLVVYVVDDDAAVRDSLALLLSLRGYRTAVFASAEDFLAGVHPDSFGCVFADLRMPGMTGLDLMDALAKRGSAMTVVIITAHGDVEAARRAFKADAVDFLEKPFDDSTMTEALEAAVRRERARMSSGEYQRRNREALAVLTGREREVMALLVQGLHNRDVARRLGISARTVEVHKARIMAKLGAGSLAELIRIANATPP
jgi:RNA polymerase sigma factor (sigma-70 family)